MAVNAKHQANGYSPSTLPAAQQQNTQVASDQEEATFQKAIILLAVVALVVILAATLMKFLGKTVSDGVLAIGSTAIGGLAGIIVPRMKKS